MDVHNSGIRKDVSSSVRANSGIGSCEINSLVDQEESPETCARVLANCLEVNVQFGVLGMWMTLNSKFDMPCALSYVLDINPVVLKRLLTKLGIYKEERDRYMLQDCAKLNILLKPHGYKAETRAYKLKRLNADPKFVRFEKIDEEFDNFQPNSSTDKLHDFLFHKHGVEIEETEEEEECDDDDDDDDDEGEKVEEEEETQAEEQQMHVLYKATAVGDSIDIGNETKVVIICLIKMSNS